MTGRALSRLSRVGEPRGFGAALVVVGSLPAAFVIAALASDFLAGTRWLGANPIKEAEHFLGRWALRLLVATLTVSPLRSTLAWHWLARHRRTLGLLAFSYALLHWLTYALLDVQLDWAELTKDLLKRPFIYLGMAALLLMLPLAVTSTAAAIRRLGGTRWRRLHRLVYPVAVLGCIHYFMAVKRDISEPLPYAMAFGLLFAWRIRRVRVSRRTEGRA